MADPGAITLVVVPAYYIDPGSGQIVEALLENRLFASDAADKWNGFRADMLQQLQMEPLLSPPNDPNDPRAGQGYTKAMFRTPEDQALLYQENPKAATPMDQGAHQAGRAFDLDLDGMQKLYPNYDYNAIAQLAASHGFRNLANAGEPEPWHFDDLPSATYGSSERAIEAIGNTYDQVQADIAQGQARPEQLAVDAYNSRNLLLIIGGLGVAWGLWYTIEEQRRPRSGHHSESAADKKGPSYVF